jgi:hypothetical protein
MVEVRINGKRTDREFQNMGQALAFAANNGECVNAEKLELAYAGRNSKGGGSGSGGYEGREAGNGARPGGGAGKNGGTGGSNAGDSEA